MTRVKEDYIIGLDLGTNSTGYAVINLKNDLIKLQGKTAIGARLFDAETSAADRRNFRTARRRLKRRKWRLRFLEEFFDSEIKKIDPNFFKRLEQSEFSPLDKENIKVSNTIVFPTKKAEKKYHHYYPTIYHLRRDLMNKTIYHLRRDLMNKDCKFDLREIYMAIHHIVKYRGNFLTKGPVDNFKNIKIDTKDGFEKINSAYENIGASFNLNIKNIDEVDSILRNVNIAKSDKQKELIKILNSDSKTKKVVTAIIKAVLGYKATFSDLFFLDLDKESKEAWSFQFSDEDIDSKLDTIFSQLNDEEQTIILELQKMYRAISLASFIDEGKTLSETMVRKYDDYSKGYQDLKQLEEELGKNSKETEKIYSAYKAFINNDKNQDEFESVVKKYLTDSEVSKKIVKNIKINRFMSKQRTSANGILPYQLNQIELDRIIEKQKKYYPFLAEENPIEEHRKQAQYKLDELVRFRVPYYVGPMITAEQQEKTSGKHFAWMERKKQGRIDPWNFNELVDKDKTAEKFIKHMTVKDTYLYGEDVLPLNSLLYQRYEVLNELNGIRVNGHKLDTSEKQDIFENLFKNRITVSKKALIKYLEVNYHIKAKIEGLSDNTKFNSSLSTYNYFKKIDGVAEKLDDNNYFNDFEKIVEYLTIFEDGEIRNRKIKEISWLTDKQIEVLSKKRLQGWGRLSRKLLQGIVDTDGQNVIQKMWDNQLVFMQIINQSDFKAAIEKENSKFIQKRGSIKETIEDILNDAYTSPANKKAVRQAVKVVNDIIKAASGRKPKQIAIEFAREPEKNSDISKSRKSQIRRTYSKISKELIDATLSDELKSENRLYKDKYYLYFLQGGRDAYTGKKINIDDLDNSNKYQIDHILPQAFIKDDSLNNRVLTSTPLNAEKSNDVPIMHFGSNVISDLGIRVKDMWGKWLDQGLITKAKYNNLFTVPSSLTDRQKMGFINRQLVEIRQINKLVATVLHSLYPDVEIITVKSGFNSSIRKNKLYKLYKDRNVNDYHHAIDAYLTAICANFLYQVYPSLRPFFVYGQYKKFSQDRKMQKNITKQFGTSNLIWPLLKYKDQDSVDRNKIKIAGSDQIVFDREKDIIRNLQRAYSFKYMNISRETSKHNQEMFKMTVFPRLSNDTVKSRNLIPKRKNLSTEIYGGYSGNTNAYMAIIRTKSKKGNVYKVVGVPMRALSELNKLKNKKEYNDHLRRILSEYINNDSFTIIKAPVPFQQLVKDGNKKFMINSPIYMQNGKQLTLSQKSMAVITQNATEISGQDYVQVFDEIESVVNKDFELFDNRKYRSKLRDSREKFIKLNLSDQANVLKELLIALHDNASGGNLKALGLASNFGVLQKNSGITLSENAQLIYQSPTGLFEKRVKISKLK